MRQRHRIVGKVPARATNVVASSLLRRTATVAVLAAGGLVAMPADIGQQDVAGLILRSFDPATRWTVTLSAGPGGSSAIAAAPLMEVAGASTTLSVGANGERIVVEGVDPSGSADAADLTPDEDRIDRTWKGDLPGTFTTPATQRGFSAGSLLQESSRLLPPDERAMPQVAFAASGAPLSALAVARFISPRAPQTAVAALEPVPIPVPRKNATALVAANYLVRPVVPASSNKAADAMLAAYAPDASIVDQSMFDGLFATPKERPPVPRLALGPGDHWWGGLPLPSTAYTEPEQRCLAEAIYFEARGESEKGQLAVAQVVLNRVRNPAYPDSICKVVYQNEGKRDACQFSYACDGIKDVVRPGSAWTRARKVARDATFGGAYLAELGTATHYHATYVRPNWASVFKKQEKIGRHVFYQTRYGGWS
ncbi:cell wall hydrolase [Chthonobacter albigriseus]|uniref:cell wall hydrolase n=1 Tax=Chthonobacter albigriseus TaxID=1683161 RepID=UPI0019D636B0|nr:cell wall hydrolase [Chthonobacter albigriseus]